MNMHNWFGGSAFSGMPFVGEWGALILPVVAALALWSLVWKGLALWHSARRKQPVWFVVFLLVNTVGILEIVYLFFIAKLKVNELFSSHEHRTN